MEPMHGTTIVCVAREGKTAMAADGQVTLGSYVVKHGAKKIRRLYKDRVLAGFAGGVADAFALFTRFEAKLDEFQGNLERAAVELVKDWRTDRALRRLEAMLVVADAEHQLLLSGSGELISPDDGVLAIGSGGPYALAAARALIGHTGLGARSVAEESLKVAAEICIYTNTSILVEEVP
jgi:ATP-dependent HslUV protease, peptidase subunit HslV